MKKVIIVLLALFAGTASMAQKDIVVDPNAAVRSVSGNFSALKVENGIDVYLSQSDKVSVAVSASNESQREAIKTVIENDVLKIYYEGDRSWRKKSSRLRVYVSYVKLEKINASGASDIRIVDGLSGNSLELSLSGACDFSGKVNLASLKINLSGASDVKVSGKAATVDIESSGASDVKGYELVTDNCTVQASGASDVFITVNKQLNATASGASDVFYKGSGLLKEIKKSGSSTIAKKD